MRIKGTGRWEICFDPADEEGVRYVPVKPRPPITLLRHYRNPWKAAYHHFQRYSDIRVKGMLQPNTCVSECKSLKKRILSVGTIDSDIHINVVSPAFGQTLFQWCSFQLPVLFLWLIVVPLHYRSLFCYFHSRREKEHLTGHGQSEGSGMPSARLENSHVCCAAQTAGQWVIIWLYYIMAVQCQWYTRKIKR